MPKFFDPLNYPKATVAAVTILGSRLTFAGGTGGGTSGTAIISINGIANLVVATGVTNYDTSMVNWIAANLDFYYTKGFILTKGASAQVIVTPRYGWDTVNIITITTVGTQLTGTLIGVLEPDLAKAKTWHVTFGQNIVILRPKNMVNGDNIRLELNATGAFTTTWPTDSTAYYFPGGTEYVQTSTTLGTVTGTVNSDAFVREDRMTLTGSTGTANITAGGLTKLATFAAAGTTDLTQTAADFVTSWAAAYLAIGITVTATTGVLTFKVTSSDPKTAANFYAIPTIANVTTDLLGTIVSVPRGRVIMNAAAPNVIQ